MLAHSDSKAVFVEDAEQLAKIRAVERRVPDARARDRDGPGGRRARRRADRSSSCASAAAAATRRSGASATRPSAPEDICLFIYTSGTTGPPKGCLLSHGNYRAITDAVVKDSVLEDGDSAYLFLPLAHAFAILIQFVAFDLGATLAYWSRDPKHDHPRPAQVKPELLPVGAADVREDLHARHLAGPGPGEARQGGRAGREGAHGAGGGRGGARRARDRVRRGRGGRSTRTCARCSDGRIRECVTGAAPIASEILEFFYACGVPVMEGYGMTETSTSATVNRPTATASGSARWASRRTAWRSGSPTTARC